MRRKARDLALAQALRAQRGLRFVQRPPRHQRFALGQAIGKQQIVMASVSVARLRGDQKIHRHNVRALVQHLEECMLAIGAWLAPDHGRRGHNNRLALARDALAI